MVERLTFTFALTGRRNGEHGTQGVALGSGLVGLSARAWPLTGLFTHNLPSLDTLNLNTLPVRYRKNMFSEIFQQEGLQGLSLLYQGLSILYYKDNPYGYQIATYGKGGCSRLSSWTSAFGLSCTTRHGFHSFIVRNPQSGRRP